MSATLIDSSYVKITCNSSIRPARHYFEELIVIFMILPGINASLEICNIIKNVFYNN